MDDQASQCQLCGGEYEPMGALGARTWFRCRQCHMTTGSAPVTAIRNPFSEIRPEMLHELREYTQQGVPTCSFLEAVLANDLMEACKRADSDNLRALTSIVNYIYNRLPATCWGSYDIVRGWQVARQAEQVPA